MISQQNLDFYIQNNLNVLFVGRHGTGKTSSVVEAFNRHNIKFKYFSVPTMDPWVDFVGVPVPKTEGDIEFLDLVRPKEFARDDVEAIFLDEFNRGNEKTRNAVMELLQFKSINGKKFNNLRFIWAAINPEDDISQYDVQKLDPAQKDRFQIHIDVPYELDKTYFTNKYGEKTANNVYDWWSKLDEKLRNNVSPRRVDYALEIYNIGGNIRDVLPKSVNFTHLINVLEEGNVTRRLARIMEEQNVEEAKAIMSSDTMFNEIINDICKDTPTAEFFIPLLDAERFGSLLTKHIEDFTMLARLVMAVKNCDELKAVARRMYEKEEYTYQFHQACRPKYGYTQSNYSEFGTKFDSKNVFKGTSKEDEKFIESVNTLNIPLNPSIQAMHDRFKLIEAGVNYNWKHKVGHEIVVLLSCGKTARVCRDMGMTAEQIMNEFPELIPIANGALMSMNQDVRTYEFTSTIAAAFATAGIGSYIWVPEQTEEK